MAVSTAAAVELPRQQPVAGTARPLYLMVVLWGERFRNYFLDYCLPSLLSPRNLPILKGKRGCKLLVCTLREDWEAMSASPIFQLLRQYAEPVYIEIPPCPPNRSGCEHMGVGHTIATNMAFEDKAYGIALTPDMMLSDGTIATIDRYADEGARVVLAAALRFGEEPMFANLQATGAIRPDATGAGNWGQPLVLSASELVAAAVEGFHSETLAYEWDAPYFTSFPVACWWRVPQDGGILVHCFSWAPLLLDYGALKGHDTTVLETWTMDGDYVHGNFGDRDGIRIVQDSDEAFIASWAPLSDRALSLQPNPFLARPLLGRLLRGLHLQSAFHSKVYDPLKRQIFFLPVRWHTKPLTDAWRDKEARVLAKLLPFVKPPAVDKAKRGGIHNQVAQSVAAAKHDLMRADGGHGYFYAWLLQTWLGAKLIAFVYAVPGRLYRVLGYLVYRIELFYHVLDQVWSNRAIIARRVGQVLRGDRAAIDRVLWRAKAMGAQLLGHAVRGNAPPPPPDH